MAILGAAGPLFAASRQLSPVVVLLLATPLVWLLWYVWKFTVFPLLRPNEPRYLPYLTPCEFDSESARMDADRLLNSPW